MKKIFFFSLLSFSVPFAALAADITSEITLVLPSTGESYSLNNGSSFDTLTINNDNFEFAVSSGQTVVLRSGNKRNLSNNQNVSITCGSGESSINATFTSTVTFTVTPSGTCGSTSGGGGGGGGGTGATPPPAPAPAATPPPAAAATSSTPPVVPVTPPPTPATIPVPTPIPIPTPTVFFPRDLSFGLSGDDVAQLQALLAADPSIYPEGQVTGYYGALTRTAVRRFQQKYGLPQVGRVGSMTRGKLMEIFGGSGNFTAPPAPPSAQASFPMGLLTKTLRGQMRDQEVKILQEFLAKGSDIYPSGRITGYFGILTENAVKKFQAKYGIETAGIVGPLTRAKINELIQMSQNP